METLKIKLRDQLTAMENRELWPCDSDYVLEIKFGVYEFKFPFDCVCRGDLVGVFKEVTSILDKFLVEVNNSTRILIDL